jgi:hypothetical protein
MAEPKTTRNDASVEAFLDAVPDARRRDDARTVCALMAEVTGEPPAMWGDAIVGFGSRPLRYASGRELDWPVVGFSPRKAALTLYVMDGVDGYEDLLGRLGKHKTSKACLYLPSLAAVDQQVLRELVTRAVAAARG